MFGRKQKRIEELEYENKQLNILIENREEWIAELRLENKDLEEQLRLERKWLIKG